MHFPPRVAHGLYFVDSNFRNLHPRGTLLRRLQTTLGWIKWQKNGDFRAISRYISETIESRHIVTISSFYPPPKYRVKIGLIPPSWRFLFPHSPQLPSEIYLGKMQMSNALWGLIDVITSRIASDKFVLHRIQRKRWIKWNIGARNTKSVGVQ